MKMKKKHKVTNALSLNSHTPWTARPLSPGPVVEALQPGRGEGRGGIDYGGTGRDGGTEAWKNGD